MNNSLLVIACLALAGCSGAGSGSGGDPPAAPACAGGANTYEGTFAAIEKVVFEKRGCTQEACHGSAAQGGLDLRPGAAYEHLVDVTSLASRFPRVQPGNKDRSFLWLKLAAKTAPEKLPPGASVPGAPMPSGLPAISAGELEAVRLWIYSGAPRTGTVGGTEGLLDACLPEPEPIIIAPLEPPPPGTGVQLVLPEWTLPAQSEREICFASYYDVTDQVPAEYLDPTGTMFRFDAQQLRQDPQSHHLILNRYFGSADVHDPAFGAWTCAGGEREGQVCEPTDLASCGAGLCRSEIRDSFACIGFGPQSTGGPRDQFGQPFFAIGGAQSSEATDEYAPGVFAQIPTRGLLYWNAHAFNLTGKDTVMHGRINYLFAGDQRFPLQSIDDNDLIFAQAAPPFTTQTLCDDHVLPRGARVFQLTSHTHKRGKHFTVDLPDGSRLYDSFVYNDPLNLLLDPPLAFDSPDPTERTLRYCSFYDNGRAVDGGSDPETVTRYSRLPSSVHATGIGLCRPIACVSGRIGAACDGLGDDRTCDSTPGAEDGWCDACPLTGGESTENEMFILFGSYFVDPDVAALARGLRATRLGGSTGRRSESTVLALPPRRGCAAHGEHASHASSDGSSHADGHGPS